MGWWVQVRRLRVAYVCVLVSASCPSMADDRCMFDDPPMIASESEPDTARDSALKALFWAALRRQPDSALTHAQGYLELVRKKDDVLLEADAENMMGMALTLLSKHDDALVHFINALQRYEAAGSSKAAALVHSNVASAYSHLGDQEKAVRHYRKAMDVYAQLKLPMWEGGMAQELAKVYRTMGELDSAEVNFARAADRLSMVGGAHAALVRYEQARMRAARGDHEGAVPLFRHALKDLGEQGDPPARMEMTMALGEVLSVSGHADEALKVLGEAQRAAIAMGSAAAIATSYRSLADHHHRYRANDEAYMALQAHLQWRDSASRQERLAAVLEVQERFGAREMEMELEHNKVLLAQQDTRFRAVLISAGIAVLAGLALLIAYRHRQRALAALAARNKSLDRAVQEKELLLRELHHRVKNNLQTVAGLLRMQMRGITDLPARDAIRDSQDRVRSMALIHQDLYQADDPRGIDMKKYVEKLANGLLKSHGYAPDRITLRTDVMPLQLDVDTAIPIGLILNELIVNALKYAFPADRRGALDIKLHHQVDGLHLEVADDGVGFSLQAVTETGSTGFGLGMLRTFAEKLQADHEVLDEGGTTVRMRIRNYKLAG
jgi:two-component system, sensor histidine kinase PdtaS